MYIFVDNAGEIREMMATSKGPDYALAYANKHNLILKPKEEKKMAKETKEIKGITITGVRVYPVGKGNLLANVQIEIDDELVIKGLKVIDSKNGKFVAMPNEKGKDDKYYDTVFPVTKEAREYITDEVLKAYEEETSKSEKTSSRRR